MAVSVSYDFILSVLETLATSPAKLASGTNIPVHHKLTGTGATLTASTTVPVTKVHSADHALTAGAETLDLTALGHLLSSTEDFTGLKVQFILIVATAGNAAALKFEPGAATAYNIFGSATGEISVPPGGIEMFFGNDALPDVAAGAKHIDVSGTGTDSYDIIIVAG